MDGAVELVGKYSSLGDPLNRIGTDELVSLGIAGTVGASLVECGEEVPGNLIGVSLLVEVLYG